MTLVKACKMSDLEDGEIFKAELADHVPLALYMINDEIFATADICTHGEASLSEDGYIEDGKVICSWHDGAFDIRTGEPCRLPCMDPLQTFPIRIEGDTVFVDL